MEREQFWALIEQARADVGGQLGEDGEQLAEALNKRLVQLSATQITEFDREFSALSAQAGRWDVWGAAYLIGGGCSDDGFIDFRAGLIALGQEWYGKVLADPDSLAGHPSVAEAAEWDDDGAVFAELVGYAAAEAYQEVTGDELAVPAATALATLGERWDFDDDDEMRRRLPRLSALFLGWPANEGCRC